MPLRYMIVVPNFNELMQEIDLSVFSDLNLIRISILRDCNSQLISLAKLIGYCDVLLLKGSRSVEDHLTAALASTPLLTLSSYKFKDDQTNLREPVLLSEYMDSC